MARQKQAKLDEKKLSKGHLRKLNALRKSLGPEIADKAFLQWLDKQSTEPPVAVDKNAQLIAEAVEALMTQKGLKIPRGGYLLRRGRGRVIVDKVDK